MITKTIRVAHRDRSVHGRFFLPEGDGPFPAVLLSHGYNGCMTDFTDTAAYLTSQNIAALTYTFCGGSTRDESGFPSTQMTLFTEQEDLLAMLDWLKAQPQVDPGRVVLFGGSMGGLVTVLAAYARPAEVAAMVLLFPALCIPDNWNQRYPDVADIPQTVAFWELPLGREFFLSVRDLDVFKMVAQLRQPTLIAHGDRDAIVPLEYSIQAARTFPEGTLRVFPGEGHGFSPEADRQVAKMLAAHVQSISAGKGTL